MKIENIPQYKYDIPNLLNTTLSQFDELMSVYNSLQENDQITYNNYQALTKQQKYNASQLSFATYKKILDEFIEKSEWIFNKIEELSYYNCKDNENPIYEYYIKPFIPKRKYLQKLTNDFTETLNKEIAYKKKFIKGKHTTLGIQNAQIILKEISKQLKNLNLSCGDFEAYEKLNSILKEQGKEEISYISIQILDFCNEPYQNVWIDNLLLLEIRENISDTIRLIIKIIKSIYYTFSSCKEANGTLKMDENKALTEDYGSLKTLYISEKLLNSSENQLISEKINVLHNKIFENNPIAFNFKDENGFTFYGMIIKEAETNHNITVWMNTFDISLNDRTVNFTRHPASILYLEKQPDDNFIIKEDETNSEKEKMYLLKILNIVSDYLTAVYSERIANNITDTSTLTAQKQAERSAIQKKYGRGNLTVHYFSVNTPAVQYVNNGYTGTGSPKSPHYRSGTYRFNKKTGKRDILVRPSVIHKDKITENGDDIKPVITKLN